MTEKKTWVRKRPHVNFTMTESHKLLLDTLAIQTGKTRSRILEALVNYVASQYAKEPEVVMEAIEQVN